MKKKRQAVSAPSTEPNGNPKPIVSAAISAFPVLTADSDEDEGETLSTTEIQAMQQSFAKQKATSEASSAKRKSGKDGVNGRRVKDSSEESPDSTLESAFDDLAAPPPASDDDEDDPNALPVVRYKRSILKAFRNPQKRVMILRGETGSGKTTQIPQFLLDEIRPHPFDPTIPHKIACTQPRRVAATSVAARVASERNCELGTEVGYRIRFHDFSDPKETRLLFLTDGMAVREAVQDPTFSKYACVILDEAHERSVQTDVMIGLVREAMELNSRLKVIVMSATMRVEPFVEFFGGGRNCEVLQVSGRQHPVKLYYLPEPSDDYIQGCKEAVLQVHRGNCGKGRAGGEKSSLKDDADGSSDDVSVGKTTEAGPKRRRVVAGGTNTGEGGTVDDSSSQEHEEDHGEEDVVIEQERVVAGGDHDPPPSSGGGTTQQHSFLGDILVFLPGQDAIEALAHVLEEARKTLDESFPDICVCPLYAALPFEQQMGVFDPAPHGTRKVVLATNIAETSLTIPGIRFVVDSGLCKLKLAHPLTGIECLKLAEVSRAQADQRAGRAGREAAGECFRLFTRQYYESKFLPETPPEIVRSDMAQLFLTLKALGIDNVETFPFLDPPPRHAVVKAAFYLKRVRALDRNLKLTELGRKLARLPLHPQFGLILLISAEFECVAEALTIVSMLSLDTVFYAQESGGEHSEQSKKQKERRDAVLTHPLGDHLTLLQIYQGWKKAKNGKQGKAPKQAGGESSQKLYCHEFGLNHHALVRASHVREQLKKLLPQVGVNDVTSCGPKNLDQLRRCFVKACFTNLARREGGGASSNSSSKNATPLNTYHTLSDRQQAKIHPGSVLFPMRPQPDVVVYSEMVTTTKNYIRQAMAVEAAWVLELCPQLYNAGGGAVAKK